MARITPTMRGTAPPPIRPATSPTLRLSNDGRFTLRANLFAASLRREWAGGAAGGRGRSFLMAATGSGPPPAEKIALHLGQRMVLPAAAGAGSFSAAPHAGQVSR